MVGAESYWIFGFYCDRVSFFVFEVNGFVKKTRWLLYFTGLHSFQTPSNGDIAGGGAAGMSKIRTI